MKICIAHFRLGLTDGVSLQINERGRILEKLGHKVYYIGDLNSPSADLRIPYFNYKENIKIAEIQEASFGGKVDEKIKKSIMDIASEVEKQLETFWKSNRFSLIFVHNIFSLPVCLPVTIAFYKFLQKHPFIKAIGVNHDFWWDPPRLSQFKTNSSYIKKIKKDYFPPVLPNLVHTVLSVWERKVLSRRKNINSEVVTDTFDFDRPSWKINKTNENFREDAGIIDNDLVILLASRIRRRKAIELGIEFVHHLNGLLKDKRAVLMLPNDFSSTEAVYVNHLKQKAELLNVRVLWIQDLVGSEEEKEFGMKKYSLWDTYVYADCVIYPSLWEGFGNQFLEAVFAKKPIVTFEYPIFDTDIRPAGFYTVNMGKVVTHDANQLATMSQESFRKATTSLVALLDNKKNLKKTILKNFNIGKRKFNTGLQLRKYLTVSSIKYIRVEGVKSIVSPIILSGRLIASGVRVGEAYDLAEFIISEIPDAGLTNTGYFEHVVKRLSGLVKRRYVTLEIVRQFLVSDKNKNPFFIFLGGLAGKTSLSNLAVNHLGLNQPIAFDNEKYHIVTPGVSKDFLVKATYESADGYVKTVDAMYPHLLEMTERIIFDFGKYKKWCYFWEGIYLSSKIVKKLRDRYKDIYLLSVFILPKFGDIRRQYILRWQEELGVEKLKVKRNIIDGYLSNVSAIRNHLKKNIDSVASFVIESPLLEERLRAFYAILHQKLKDIGDKEIPGWVDKLVEDPSLRKNFDEFLKD